jgi:general secretion pathway protein E
MVAVVHSNKRIRWSPQTGSSKIVLPVCSPVVGASPMAVGCVCRQTGYHERTAVFEIFPVNAEVEAPVLVGKSEPDLRSLASAQGSRSAHVQALSRVCGGITTLEEALEAASSPRRAEKADGS